MSVASRALAAALALLAGVLAAVAGEPAPPPAANEIAAVDLAEAIRARAAGLVIVDTRPAAAMALERLPGAIPAPDFDGNADTVVFYGDGRSPERPALRGRARRVLSLQGGLAAWNAEVLFPAIRSDAPAHRQREFEHRARLARYFGGSPRVLDPGARATRARSRRGC